MYVSVCIYMSYIMQSEFQRSVNNTYYKKLRKFQFMHKNELIFYMNFLKYHHKA